MLATLLDYRFLVPVGLLIGLAPFYPQPHLAEKLRMLLGGTLAKPLDILDLFWHAGPLLLLGIKLGRDLGRRFNRQEGA